MSKIPSVDEMVKQYPSRENRDEVAQLIGGTVGENILDPNYQAYKNTCAIRVSYALNYAGDPIPAGGGIRAAGGVRIRTDKGGDAKWYIYSTYDLRQYLTRRYNHPKRFKGDASADDLKDIQGIIEFAYYHVDVWDGSSCAGHAYFGDSHVVNGEILVWEAP